MPDPLERLREALRDRYAIDRELGRGGMATVYLATDLKHRRPVALKVLHPELAASVGHERFLREIEIVAGLTHPRILTLIDSGEADGLLYYVMPYVEGETLRDRLDREGPLPLEESLRIAREISDALAYAHEKGVIHRDIKPSNVLFEAGHAVLSDFGIARAVGVAGSGDATATGLAVGTPRYMAPEQASGGDLDGRADVYALGCVLWEMLAGDAPFDGPTPQSILARKLSDETPSLRTRRRSVPPGVDDVIAKAMAPLAADRYASARDLERALADPRPEPGRRRGSAGGSRSRLRVAIGVAAIGLLAVAAWWLAGRGSPATAAAPYALAVLPPEAPDGSEPFFVDGQHQALIDELASLGGLRVISRRSARRFRDTDRSIPEIAEELGVSAIVASTVVKDGDSVRIRLELVEAEPEERLAWSDSYVRSVEDVFSMYREAARAIAGQVGVELSPDEDARLSSERRIDVATYESYLRGMHLLSGGTPDEIQRGLAYLHEATDRDPGDAMAWAGLAAGYATVGHGPYSPPDAWIKARAAAERAVRLDSTLADGWAVLQDVLLYYDRDWEGAERAFRRADELNPNLSMNHYHRAWYLLLVGRNEEALAEHLRAQELDPLFPAGTSLLGAVYLYLDDTERASELARQGLAMAPDEMFGLLVLGAAFSMEGRHEEAIATHERMAELYPIFRPILGRTYAVAGRREEAERIAAELEGVVTNPVEALGLASLYTELGRNDDAYRWIGFEPDHAWTPWAAVDPILTLPRDDPRFAEFLERYDLPRPE